MWGRLQSALLSVDCTLARSGLVSLLSQPDERCSNYCVNRKIDQPNDQPFDCEAHRLRLNINAKSEKERTGTKKKCSASRQKG
jgi:hypothetical protein